MYLNHPVLDAPLDPLDDPALDVEGAAAWGAAADDAQPLTPSPASQETPTPGEDGVNAKGDEDEPTGPAQRGKTTRGQ